MRFFTCLALFCALATGLRGQTLNDIDTTYGFGREMFKLYQRFDAVRFSGYIQPQFQFAEKEGAHSFAGGDFAPHSNNRFMLRRGRIRLDYAQYNAAHQPVVFFVFQFDGTERGVAIRDFWGRIFENKFHLFALTTGMFARPFGYELLLGSSDRESPERGRMSQTLMRVERDMGAMFTFEPRSATHPLHWLKVDVAVLNGQGLTGPVEFDSHKDIIGRISAHPLSSTSKWKLALGTQAFLGGMREQTNEIHRWQDDRFVTDTSASNVGHIAPRRYFGADAQLKIPNRHGWTEFRAEFIAGRQTATQLSSETPGVFPQDAQGRFIPLYVRPFNGAYFYWLQHLGSTRHQLVVKYDWYDPNSGAKGLGLGEGFSIADVKFSTLGIGYVYYANEHLKITTWYDWIQNEKTRVAGLTEDVPDDIFTCRIQYRF